MYKILYNSLSIYFNALSKLGHMSYDQVEKIIVLTFITNLIYRDYRGNIKREDYHAFEQALNSLFGSTCLIPFTDYNKMGKLHIGEIGELLSKIQETAKHVDEVENHLEINDGVTVSFADRIAEDEQKVRELNERVGHEERVNKEQRNVLIDHSDRLAVAEENITNSQQDINELQNEDDRIKARVTSVENRIDTAESNITQNAEDIKQNRQRIETLEDAQ